MGVSQFYDAMIKMESQPKGADDPVYKPPKGHDREMSAGERHAGKFKPRHGQDATGKIPMKKGYSNG